MVSDLLAERNVRTTLSIPYGDHPRQKLDIYHARELESTKPAPIVVFLYGGAWTTGERACYSFVGSALAARGITTVIPDYRLFPNVQYPAFNEDAAAAYIWTAHHVSAARQQSIFLMGHSAGAHIATLVSYDRNYLASDSARLQQPAGVIGLSGPYGFDPTSWPTTKDIFATAPDAETPRPISHVGSHCPPSLLIYGLKDDVVHVENARELTSALRAAGSDAKLLEYSNLGHIGPITSFLRFSRWRAPVLRECVNFIDGIAEHNNRQT